jgi:hypothetical protein
MRTAGKLAVVAASVAVVAGLTALAAPAVAPLLAVGEGVRNTADTLRDPAVAPSPTPTVEQVILTEDTDYTTWTEEELAPLRAEPPSLLINHPSRFAADCRQNSMMNRGFTLQGAQTMVDMGPRTFAAGEVTRDAKGRLLTYTVAPGDAREAIGDRFCTDYVTILMANDIYPTIHPGDVLRLAPSSH